MLFETAIISISEIFLLPSLRTQLIEFIAAKLHQSEHRGTWIEFEYYDFWRAPFIFEASFKGAEKFNICVQLDWKSLESVACFEAGEREAKIKKLMLEFSDTDRRKLATLCFLLRQKSDEISKIFYVKNANDLMAAFAERQLDFETFGDICTKYLMNINQHKEISTALTTNINDEINREKGDASQPAFSGNQSNVVNFNNEPTNDLEITRSKKLPYLQKEVSIEIVSRELISTQPFGEETLFFDYDFDGDMELLFFPASTRSSYFPEQNDVAVFEVGPNSELQAQFSIIESQQFKGASKIKSNLDLSDFKSGWLQNVEVEDFDDDGHLDLFFSGHGREWPSANILSGDDQGNDELFRKAQELYKSWPGDFSRILMSNSGNPNVIRVNETPFFAHSAKVGDVNGDSKLDVVSLNIGEPRGYDRTNIFLGNGNGRFDLLNAPNDAAVEWKSHKLRNNLNTYFGVSTVEVADFNNDGVEAVTSRLRRKKSKIIVGGNIGKNKLTPNELAINDYEICFEKLFDYVDYFVVNVSSPNTPGLRDLQDKEPLTKLLNHIQKLNHSKPNPKPLLLKIAPDLTNTQLDDIVEIVKETRLDGVVATNTTINRDNLKTDKNKIDEIGNGGLSGKPLKDRSTEVIKYLSLKSKKSFAIIGVGGISCSKDAKEKLEAGADLVQIYTGFIYQGPSLVKKINLDLIKNN